MLKVPVQPFGTEPLAAGDRVILDDGSGDQTHVVTVPAAGETVKVRGVGVLAQDVFEGRCYGDELQLGRTRLRLLPVTPARLFASMERSAQIIRPLDAARIAHGCAIGPGSIVVEGGVGSGALTTYLAYLVGQEGKVHGFDLREDHLGTARRNVEAAGLEERVSFEQGDLADTDTPCHAFIADVPDPASIVPAAERCLMPGGMACFYNPLVSQVEATREALAAHAFSAPETLEQLERRWVVHERGARPDFSMLGHTGFLTFATRISQPG